MGFFKNLAKGLNPLEHLKNPKEGAKHFLGTIVDPAGTTIREGRGKSALTGSIKDYYDPAGLNGGAPQAAPNSYMPGRPMQLSPGAQALYDSMKARTAARNAAMVPQAAAPQVAPQPMQQPQGPGIAPQYARRSATPQPQPQPMPYQPPAPQMLADGGKVEEFDGDYWENKSFEWKPNGKPY